MLSSDIAIIEEEGLIADGTSSEDVPEVNADKSSDPEKEAVTELPSSIILRVIAAFAPPASDPYVIRAVARIATLMCCCFMILCRS